MSFSSFIAFWDRIKIIQSILILVILAISCRGKSNRDVVDKVHENKIEISKAERFNLEKKNGYTILTIMNPWQGAKDLNQVYYLVYRGNKIPALMDTSLVILVPDLFMTETLPVGLGKD